MTDRDMGNLMFLLKANDETFRHWLENCSFDDIAYANELITAYRKEKNYNDEDKDIRDLSVAKNVLSKFTLGTKLNNG